MFEAMGLPTTEGDAYIQIADAGRLASLPSRRMLLSTLPVPAQPWRPHQRHIPWERNWRPHWRGDMQPVMRTRQQTGHVLVGPAYQYGLGTLLYDAHGAWRAMDLPEITAHLNPAPPA